MSKPIKLLVTCICVCVMLMLISGSVYAKRARTEKNALEAKEFRIEELYISQTNVPSEQILSKLVNYSEWNSFLAANRGTYVHFDPRSGRPASIVNVFPLIPGTGDGNNITLDSLSRSLGYKIDSVGEKEVRAAALQFLNNHANLLAIDMKEIGEIRIQQVTDFLWQINIRRQVNGIPVRDANIVLSINHGNLVVWGLEKWGNVVINLAASVTKDQAINTGMGYVGGQLAIDKITVEPHLEIVPISSPTGGIMGEGYSHRLAWVFDFSRKGYINNWEILVDAHRNEIIAMRDLNDYAWRKIVGATYTKTNDDCCPDGCPVYGEAMSYTNTGLAAPNNLTNLSGMFDWTSGTVTTTLNGTYVRVVDTCGAISESSATGDIDMLGTYNQHDCAVPAGHSAGDTFSTRTCANEVAWTNRMIRGWITLGWLDTQQITCNVNTSGTCNAFYTGNTINFYPSGGGCRNTGEETASIDHEWAHGLDAYDAGGASNPGEVYADLMSVLKLHNDCPDRGWWWTLDRGCGSQTCPTNPSSSGYMCDGYGDCCTTCTGLRELDWAKHVSNTPHTPANFNCVRCGSGSAPCGKEEHCENAPGAEAGWDLATRDLTAAPFNMDRQTALLFTTKIYAQGSVNVTNWYSCTCPSTSSGCAAANGYMQWITADDDNGNLNNGTPHMTAIYNAFNRHAIACSTITPTNSGCAGAPTQAPTLTVTPSANGASLSWTAVTGAASYNVFKATGTFACDMERIKIANVTTTTYTDTTLNCHETGYAVQAVGSTANCLGPLSACALVTPPLGAPVNVTATGSAANQVTVNWNAVTGATGYNVYRKVTVCGSEQEIKIAGPITTTTYVDSPVSGGVTYQYAVSAISSTCGEHSKSNYVSVVPTGDCALTPCFTGATSATNNQLATCGITVRWSTGTSSCPTYPTIRYNLYRSTVPAFIPGPANLLASCLTGTVQNDTNNLSNNTTYYYVVRAEDSRTGGAGPCNGGDIDANTAKVNATTSGPYSSLFTDGFESGIGNWTISTRWQAAVTYAHTGTYSLISTDPTGLACATCSKTTGVAIPAGSPANFTFWTRYTIESGYDGGIVYGSSDGATWIKLTPVPAYPATVNGTQACLGASGSPAFSGSNTTWTQYAIALTTYQGVTFRPRFTYGTDPSVSNGGWFIDDVAIGSFTACVPATTADPGRVLNTLTVAKSSTNLSLSWSAPASPCAPTAYGLYRGTLPWTAYNHASVSCTISTTTTTTPQDTSSYYYLIVPLVSGAEGSYGRASSGTEIPAGSSPCRTTQDTGACV